MPKKKTIIQVVDDNLHVKGSLLVDGKIGSRGQLEALVVTSQLDLNQEILSSFVPIVIPPDASITELRFTYPALYNRHLLVENLSGHNINLLVPVDITTRLVTLPTHRHANIAIIASKCPPILHSVVDIPALPTQEVRCSFTATLEVGQSFAEYVELFAGRLDLILNQDPNQPFASTLVTQRGTPTLVTQRFPIGSAETIGVMTLNYDISSNIITITATGTPEICSAITRLLRPGLPGGQPSCDIFVNLPSDRVAGDLANYLAAQIDLIPGVKTTIDGGGIGVQITVLTVRSIVTSRVISVIEIYESFPGIEHITVTGDLDCQFVRDIVARFLSS